MKTIAELNEQEIFVALTSNELDFLMEETDFFKSKEFCSINIQHVGTLKYGDTLYEMDKDCYELLKEVFANSDYNPKREIFNKIEETLDEEEGYFKRFMKTREDLIKKRDKLFSKLSESEREEIIEKMKANLSKNKDWYYAFIDRALQTLKEDPEKAKDVFSILEKTSKEDNEEEERDCEKCLFASACDKSKKSDYDNDFDTGAMAKGILKKLGIPDSNIHVIDLSEILKKNIKKENSKSFKRF